MSEIDFRARISATVGPLRRIFWGGILCVFDITLKSGNFKFDILNDVVGKLLIAWGVFRLASIGSTPSYRRAMRFAQVVSIFSTIRSFLDQWTFQKGRLLELLWITCHVAEIAAILVFCFSMRLLSVELDLFLPAQSWRTTAAWFLLFYVLPLGVIHLFQLIHLLKPEVAAISLGPLSWLLLVVLLPMIHLFVSTSRTKRAAEAA